MVHMMKIIVSFGKKISTNASEDRAGLWLESTVHSDFLVEDFKCVDRASDSCGWTRTEAP